MRRSFFMFLGLAVLSLGVYVASWAQSPLSPKDLAKLVADDAEVIQKTLAKDNLEKDKKSQRKMRLAALMIAQYAQSAIAKENPKSASMATLRNQALAVHKAIEEMKFADAKTLAAKLSVDIPPDAGAKMQPVDLAKLEDFDSVMHQFSSIRLGGFGLEEYVEGLGELKQNPDAAEAQKIDVVGKKLAMIATLAQSHTPPMLGGAKTLDAWKGFSKSMYQESLNLTKAAASGKAADISKAAVKVNDTCKSCHDVFR
jgi:Cytochrome C'